MVIKPPKTETDADRFSGPALASHGIYIRGKVIWALFDDLATRIYMVSSFETALGAAQEGGSVVINYINPIPNMVWYASVFWLEDRPRANRYCHSIALEVAGARQGVLEAPVGLVLC